MGQNKRIAGFGDSILKGVLRQDSHYTIAEEPFLKQISARMDVETVNYGRFGSTIAIGNKIVTSHLKDISRYRYTLLEFGGNDSDFNWLEVAGDPEKDHRPNTEMSEFAITYKEILDKIRFAGSKPVLLSLPPISSKKYFNHITSLVGEKGKENILSWLRGSIETIGNWHELYNLEIFKLGGILQVPVVDISSCFLARRNYEHLLCEDGIHPNTEGQKLIADSLCSYFATA